MKKFALISIVISLFLGGGFFGVNANDYIYKFGFFGIQEDAQMFMSLGYKADVYESVFDVLTIIRKVYGVEDLIETLPFVIARNSSILIGDASDQHAAADEEVFYEVDPSQITDFLQESQTFEEFYQKVRIDIIEFLVKNTYSGFNIQPYGEENLVIMEQSGDFKVLKNVEENDGLDILLKDTLSEFQNDFASLKEFESYLNFKKIEIDATEYSNLGTLFMFKNERDLRDLGYELISWKSRNNTDRDYRIYNIKTAFDNIGNVRLIMPGETFSLGRELHYNPNFEDGNEVYVDGYATVGNGVKMIYGGGLCGVATAFYQGTLTNLALDLIEYRAHSIYYRNLYEAEVNGTYIKDPGLDATLYTPQFDLVVKNTRPYPVVVGFYFDGLSGSVEQVFTLSKAQDRGSFEYIGKYWKGASQCFTWKINGEKKTNCYRHVKNF